MRTSHTNKLIAGFTAFAATAIIATSGLAAAQTMDKPTKAQCLAAGFTNFGQCVKEWAHNKNNPGSGYGNNVSVTTNLNLTLDHSNDNVISVINNIMVKIMN